MGGQEMEDDCGALDCGDLSPLSPAGLVPRPVTLNVIRGFGGDSRDGDKSPFPKR